MHYLASPKNYVCLEHFFRGNHAKNVIGTECWIYPCTCLFDASIKNFIIMYNIICVHIIYYKISTLIAFTNLNTIKLPYLILCIVGLHINMTCSLHVSKSILTSHLISEEETFKLDCFCIKPSKLYYCAFYKLFIAYSYSQWNGTLEFIAKCKWQAMNWTAYSGTLLFHWI